MSGQERLELKIKKPCEALVSATIKCYSIFNINVLKARKLHKEMSCSKKEHRKVVPSKGWVSQIKLNCPD